MAPDDILRLGVIQDQQTEQIAYGNFALIFSHSGKLSKFVNGLARNAGCVEAPLDPLHDVRCRLNST